MDDYTWQYIEDGSGGVIPMSLDDGLVWLDIHDRRVAWHRWFNAEISTVFMVHDHGMTFGTAPPVLYETRVEGGELDGVMWRYNTRAQAIAGHVDVLRRVMAASLVLPWWRLYLWARGHGRPVYGVPVFEGDIVVRLPWPWRRTCANHDRVRALDVERRVLPFLVCVRCRSRLEWPNMGIGKVVDCEVFDAPRGWWRRGSTTRFRRMAEHLGMLRVPKRMADASELHKNNGGRRWR